MAQQKLFVGSVPNDVTQEEIQTVFGTYGNVSDIHIMAGKSTSGQSCAFVIFDSVDSANNAINSLNGIYSFRDDGTPPVSVSWARQGGSGGAPRVANTPMLVGGVRNGMGAGQQGMSPYRPAGVQDHGGYYGGNDYGGHSLTAAAGGYQQPPPAATPKTKLFVGNLPTDIQAETLRMVFSHYGNVTNIHVMQGRAKSGQSCAFVEYSTALEAETAILTLHEKYEIRPGEGSIIVKNANNSGPRTAPY